VSGEELLAYYAHRAHEYEQIYAKPERQIDLARVRTWLRQALAGERILEVACGTGYWTAEVASVAVAMVATDASPKVLLLAQQKEYPPDRVRFELADAYTLAHVAGTFTAGFAAFWWSHVPRERQTEFLASLHGRLGAGAKVVLLDNRYVAGSSTPIVRWDAPGNSYQHRRLADGTEYEVLKNFPTGPDLEAALIPVAQDLNVMEFEYYWGASYRVASVA
jgi:SAM-dependent methyltransferase